MRTGSPPKNSSVGSPNSREGFNPALGAETRSASTHGLHFSGGEPFMNFELLLEAVAIAEALNIPSTLVETNCYWCTSDRSAMEKLRSLKEAGLKGILISVNPYYAEFVPFERTERCIEASLSIFGENVAVYQLEYYLLVTQSHFDELQPREFYEQLTNRA
jgi:hypothetical protein